MNLRSILLATLVLGASHGGAAEAKAPAAATPPAAAPAPRPAAAVEAPARGGAASAPRNNASLVTPAATFDAFRVISDRNIFNPYRTPGRRERTEAAGPRTDTITLVGTGNSDKGQRAFFDGSSSSYRKTLRVGDSIDQFKLTRITPHVVEFERDGKAVSVGVGQQLRRPEGGDWNVVGEEVARRDAQVRPGGGANAAAKAAEIPADADPVLRRMMEARQKSLKQ